MGKINVYDKIMIENKKKKRKYGNKRNFYINLHLRDGLGMESTVNNPQWNLSRLNASGNADIIYRM